MKLDVVYTKENVELANELNSFLQSNAKPEYSLWGWAIQVPILDRMNELLLLSTELRDRFESDEIPDGENSVLDLGCGFCVYWPFLKNAGYKSFVGIDLYTMRNQGDQLYMKTAGDIITRFCGDDCKTLLLEDDVRNLSKHETFFYDVCDGTKFDLIYTKNTDYQKLGSTGIPRNLFDSVCSSYLKADGIGAYAG